MHDPLAQLQSIQASLEANGKLNGSVIGASVYAQVEVVLRVPGLDLVDVDAQLQTSPPQLDVHASATVYGQAAALDLLFYFDAQNALQLVLSFDAAGTFASLYSSATGRTAPADLLGLSGSDKLAFVLVTDPAGHAGVAQGVALSGSASLSGSGTLMAAFRAFQPAATSVSVSGALTVPVFGSDPADFSLTLSEKAQFPLSADFRVDSLNVQLCVACSTPVSFTVQVSGATGDVSLSGSLTGNWNAAAGSFALTGSLSGSWSHPLGLSWLTSLQSSQSSMSLTASSGTGIVITALTLTGSATTSLSSTPVGFTLKLSGSSLSNRMLQITNIPLASGAMGDLVASLGAGSGAVPQTVAGVQVSGSASITVADYSSGSVTEGLTLSADASLSDAASAPAIAAAAQMIAPGVSVSSYSFAVSLYVPIFSSTPGDVQFSLSEQSQFAISGALSCTGFSVDVDVQGAGSGTLMLQAGLSNSQTGLAMKFQSTFSVSSSVVSTASFSGALSADWVHPFGLQWLTLDAGSSVTGSLSASAGITAVSLTGSAQLTFSPGSTGIDVSASLSGADLSNFYLKVQNIPVGAGDAPSLYAAVASTSAPSSGPLTEVAMSGTAGVCVSNYACSACAVGVTVTANVQLSSGGSGVLHTSARYVAATPETLAFVMSLAVPVFTQTPEDVSLTLSETDTFPLAGVVSCTGFSLKVQIAQSSLVTVSAGVSAALPHSATPLTATATGTYRAGSSGSLSLSASAAQWDHPFGFTWLDVTALSASLQLALPGVLQSMDVSGTAQLTFGSQNSGDVSISSQLSNNFRDVVVALQVSNVWSTADIIDSVLTSGMPSSLLQDLALDTDVSLTLAVSTFDGTYPAGITIDTTGKLTNSLLSSVEQHAYWYSKDLSGMTFSLSLTVPVFSSDPADVDLTFTLADHIVLTPHLALSSVDFSLKFAPLAVSLAATAVGNFSRNPPLTFELSGTYDADASVVIDGGMIGTWDNAFGLQGFDLSNVLGEIGFNPTMCAATACISDVGFNLDMEFGSETVAFAGRAAAPDFLDIFLAGSVKGANGMALTVLDVVEEWNSLNTALQIPTDDFPSDWGLADTSFFLAPQHECIASQCYPQGFGITTGIVILEMSCDLSINCTDASGCDFAFHTDLNLTDFENMIKSELGVMQPPPGGLKYYDETLTIFRVNNLSLTQWSQENVAGGTQPFWSIGITVFNKEHLLEFHVHHQYDLSSSFHDFFDSWLKNLFE